MREDDMLRQDVTISLAGQAQTRGLFLCPPAQRALFVFAHGAGAGMRHAFMEDVAQALCVRGVATLRFDFPYMHQCRKTPDRPAVAHEAVRAAVAAAVALAPATPVFAGGKSFGGRMTSQAQAIAAMPGVRGLVFTGFPLHPRKAPSRTRAQHLREIAVPMLFIQGARDDLADMPLMADVCKDLGAAATLAVIEAADHAFAAPKRAQRPQSLIIDEIADAASSWMSKQL